MADQDQKKALDARVALVRKLTGDPNSAQAEYRQAAILAQSIVHDTVGGSHPIMAVLERALSTKSDWSETLGAARAVLDLYDQGALRSPRLTIAREIEGDILDLAEAQARAAEQSTDPAHKQIHLAIGAFLAGAAIEDALRRLCDAHGAAYAPQRATISTFQAALYQPSKNIEIISKSENKQVTAWADTRNKADHAKFGEITHTELVTMIVGARGFIEKHLP
jgi:hypothetical protein